MPPRGVYRHHVDKSLKYTVKDREDQLRWLIMYPGDAWIEVARCLHRDTIINILIECSRLSRIPDLGWEKIPECAYDALLSRGRWSGLVKCCIDNDLPIDYSWPIRHIIATSPTWAASLSLKGYKMPHNYVHRHIYDFIGTIDEYMKSSSMPQDPMIDRVISLRRWQASVRKKISTTFSDVTILCEGERITNTSGED